MQIIHKSSTSRITSQQQSIFLLLKHDIKHFTADDIYRQVRKSLPRISLGTIYRNLDKLVSGNLAAKVIISGIARYESNTHPHYHTVCLSCNRIDDLESSPATDIEEFFSRNTAYKLTSHELVLYGLCPSCQKKR